MSMLKEKPFLTPNDAGLMGTDDAVSIQNAIDAAAEAGVNKVVIPRYNKRTDSVVWTITATIRIPSDMTLVFDNCYLQLAQGYVGQMFTNSHSCSEEGKLIAGEQTNIRILGKGEAVLDGGITEEKDTESGNVWDRTLLYFHNVRNFTVDGLRVIDQRGWGLCFMYCAYGKVSNIEFDAKGNVPNQDGIVLRCGCHDLTVENITGYAGNDVVALAAVAGQQMEVPYSVMGHSVDVRNIIVRNIKATTRGGANIVSLFNQDGLVLYNILIEHVSDISTAYADKRPFSAVRIGGKKEEVNVREVLHGETKNITVSNVFTRARYGVAVSATLADSLIESLHVHDDGEVAVGVCPVGEKGVTTVSNLLLKGIYYNVDQKSADGSAELAPSEYVGGVICFENCEGKNISVRDVFCDKAAYLVEASGEVAIDVTGAVVDELGDTLVKKAKKAKVTLKNVKVKGEVQK